MGRPILVCLSAIALLGCGGNQCPVDSSTDTDTIPTTTTSTTPVTTPTTNTNTTTPTTSTPGPFSKLRIVHVAPDLTAMDLYVNEAAIPVMNDLIHEDGTAYTDRPVGMFHFDYSLAGYDAINSLVEFDSPLFDQQWHSHAIVGVAGAYEVWTFDDDNRNVGVANIRIRWTHAAVGLGEIDLVEEFRGITVASDLSYGDSVVVTSTAGPTSIGVDLDDDGLVDWTFEEFDLGTDQLVNIYITDNGEPLIDQNKAFLIAHRDNGLTPRQDVIVVP